MSLSPDNFPRGARPHPRLPQQILEELFALRHNESNVETGKPIIESLVDAMRREADYLDGNLRLSDHTMEAADPAEKEKLLADIRNTESKIYGVNAPDTLVGLIREFAELLKRAEADLAVVPEKERIVKGLCYALIPILNSQKTILTQEEASLNREDSFSERGLFDQICFAADPQAVVAEEQYIAFLRHAGALLIEWCDHPEIAVSLPKKVRDRFHTDIGVSPSP